MMTPAQRAGQQLLDANHNTVWLSFFRAALTGAMANVPLDSFEKETQTDEAVKVASWAADEAMEHVVRHNEEIDAAMNLPEKVRPFIAEPFVRCGHEGCRSEARKSVGFCALHKDGEHICHFVKGADGVSTCPDCGALEGYP